MRSWKIGGLFGAVVCVVATIAFIPTRRVSYDGSGPVATWDYRFVDVPVSGLNEDAEVVKIAGVLLGLTCAFAAMLIVAAFYKFFLPHHESPIDFDAE